VHRSREYPPKYVLSLAAELGLGRELSPGEFGGGTEANRFLRRRGYEVRGEGGEAVEAEVERERPARPRRQAVTVEPSGDAIIARITLRDPRDWSPEGAETALLRAFTEEWPRGVRADITITPGGLVFERHEDVWAGSYGWETTPHDFQAAVHRAVPTLRKILTTRVWKAARHGLAGSRSASTRIGDQTSCGRVLTPSSSPSWMWSGRRWSAGQGSRSPC
jgi:hypothetical protein